MRISTVVGYYIRLALSGIAGVYMVAGYGFPTVVVLALAVFGLSLLGFNLLGQHKVITLVVFVFAAMVGLHYGWRVPIPYYTFQG